MQYELLTGHHRTDGTYKTTEQLLSEYVHLTDGLIYRMTEGVEVSDPVAGQGSRQRPEYVVYLDKSGRPVQWLTRNLWPRLAANPHDPGRRVPPMPASRFVNIDREQWADIIDPLGVGHMNVDRVDVEVIRSLRSVFVAPRHKRNGLSKAIDDAPAELDGKAVLIVDEVRSTGRTLQIAREFFHRAFPTARVGAAHWMGGIAGRRGATGNADLPVWYTDRTHLGGASETAIRSNRLHRATSRSVKASTSSVRGCPRPTPCPAGCGWSSSICRGTRRYS